MFETLAPTPGPEPAASPRDLGGLLGIIGDREVAFPLREVKVRAAMAANCCRTVVEQVFDNPYETALEAVHIFPLPPRGAVTELDLRAGDTVVRAECRERQAAERAFEAARMHGRRAALLTEERADVHTLRVTNVPPSTSVRVRIVIVERLEEADGTFDWRFPTVIAPRYLPGVPVGHQGEGVLPDTDAAPDASRLQPPLRIAGGTKLDLEVEIAGPLAVLDSSLHAVRTTIGEVVRVAPSGQATLDRDFVLRFAAASSPAASLRAYTDGRFALAVVNPPAGVDLPRVPRDVVLVVDVSGSMDGRKLEAARRAVSAVLHGLEKGDRFRLIAFESQVHAHTPDLLPFDQDSLRRADRWIGSLKSLGGTEMLPALEAAFAGATPAGRLHTVIFITDGQAWNEQQLVALVERHRAGALLFTVGIDTAVNQSLLRRLADVGGGTCELLTPADDIEEAIARLEARFGSPVLVLDQAPAGFEAARPGAVCVFAGRPATLLLRGAASDLRLTGTDAAGRAVEMVPDAVRPVSLPLGALWARDRVAWLEDQLAIQPAREAQVRSDILAVALEHRIASRFTAFVAVEERVSNEGERVTVVQPVELPDAWSRTFLEPSPAAPILAAACLPAAATFPSADPEDDRDADLSESMPAFLRRQPPPAARLRARAVLEPLFSRPFAFRHDPPEPAGSGDPREIRRSIETALATAQDADGSYGGDLGRTAAAMVTLIRLGHTRARGSRRRVVQKCARWLARQAGEPIAQLALDLLARAESGGELPRRSEVADLLRTTPEGGYLERALDAA